MGKRSERRSAGSQSVRARALLTECRALALESLLEHLNNAVEQLAAAVLAARTNADPDEPQSPLFRAIETVYNHRAEFVATFGREYRTHLDKPRDDEVTGSPSATEQTLLTEMALVETDAMDLLLLSSDLTRRALNQIESDMEGSGEQYWALRLRVGQISDSESLDIRDNPLAVQRVMHALIPTLRLRCQQRLGTDDACRAQDRHVLVDNPHIRVVGDQRGQGRQHAAAIGAPNVIELHHRDTALGIAGNRVAVALGENRTQRPDRLTRRIRGTASAVGLHGADRIAQD